MPHACKPGAGMPHATAQQRAVHDKLMTPLLLAVFAFKNDGEQPDRCAEELGPVPAGGNDTTFHCQARLQKIKKSSAMMLLASSTKW